MRRRVGVLGVLGILAFVACADDGTRPPAPGPAAVAEQYLIGSRADLLALPVSGPGWEAVLDAAEEELRPDLADQDRQSAIAFAAALVHARTGDEGHRRRVVAALEQLQGTEDGGRTLALGRQLAGWVLAADLVGYRDPAFLDWLDQVRTAELGRHGRWRTLRETHEATASNWGTLAGASRLAASLYLDDADDVAAATGVLRGWLGDADAWSTLPVDADRELEGFLPTQDFDESWACEYPAWTPVNPDCGERDGALVEDISRGDRYPDATEDGLRYSWEALQGAYLQAVLLAAAGEADVWSWGEEGLRRAVAFLERNGGFEDDTFDTIHHWVPWAAVAVYGEGAASTPPVAGPGRSFGFADWLGPLLAAPRASAGSG